MYFGIKKHSKYIAKILVLILVIGMAMPTVGAFAQTKITDIKQHWAEKIIDKWLDKDMIKGYSDGTFKPEKPITRAEFISLVNKAMSFTSKGTIKFNDVKTNDWFYEQLELAIGANYIGGFEDQTFRPNNLVSREQAACIVARIKGLTGNASSVNIFTDKDKISAWAKESVSAVVTALYMKGYDDGTFRPDKSLTRAEAVYLLDKLLKAEDYVITKAGTKLSNKVIEGNLIIDKSVGEGEVFLENVTVKGNTYIYGGGKNSIHFIDCDLYDVYVEKENGVVRIVFEGSTEANIVNILSQVLLELKDKAVIDKLNISEEALKSIISLAQTTGIKEIIINANEIQIIGNGTIAIIENHGTGNKSDIKPGELKGDSKNIEIKAPSSGGGSVGGGTGGGTTPTVVAVTGISLDKTTVILSEDQQVKLTATVEPNNATNKEVTWSSSDARVATVDANGMVSAVKKQKITGSTSLDTQVEERSAIITATTKDGNKTAICKVIITTKPVTLQSINIKTQATKLVYYVGEDLDMTSLVVEGIYSDGSKKDITITKSNITGFDSSRPVASQTLTITYEGKTASYDIEIKEKYDAIPSNAATMENFNTHNDATYKGVNVGWRLADNLDFNDIDKIEVRIFSNDNLLVTNTAVLNKHAELYNGGTRQFSTPFAFESMTDDYWTFGNWNEDINQKPDKAELVITGKVAGDVVIFTNNSLADVAGMEWNSLFPPIDQISIYNVPLVLEVGESTILRAKLNDQDIITSNIKWSVENLDGATNVATIEENSGIVTANNEGRVRITATYNNNITDSFELQITKVENLSLISDPGYNYAYNRGELHIYIDGNAAGKTIDTSKLTIKVGEDEHTLSNVYIKSNESSNACDYATYYDQDALRTAIVIKLTDADKTAINTIIEKDKSNCNLIISAGFVKNQSIAHTSHLNIQNVYKLITPNKEVKTVEHYENNNLCWRECSDNKIEEIWIGSWETNLVLYTENGNNTRPVTGYAIQIPAKQQSVDSITIADNQWQDLQNTVLSSIKLDYWNNSVVNCNVGNKIQVNLVTEPVYAPVANVTWTTSGENVATVDKNGVVTTIAVGKATIIARVSNLEARIDIEVVDDIKARLVLNNNELQIIDIYNLPDPNNNNYDFSKITLSNGTDSYTLTGSYSFIGWDNKITQKGKYSIIFGSRLYIGLTDEDYNGVKALLSNTKPLILVIDKGLHSQTNGIYNNINVDEFYKYTLPQDKPVRLINLYDAIGHEMTGWYTPNATMESFLISKSENVKYIVLATDWQDVDPAEDVFMLQPPANAEVALLDVANIVNYNITSADIKWQRADTVKVTDIKIVEYGKDTVPTMLKVGESVELTAIVTPLHGYTRELQWGGASEIISISKYGKVTALKPGIAKIQVSVTYDGGYVFDDCEIKVVTSYNVIDNATDLQKVIANSVGGEEIILEGQIGSPTDYTIYNITKPITIKSTTNAKVYGSFIINTDNVTIEGLTIENKYVDGNESASKNAINIYADYVNITNNIISTASSVENYEPNGIVIFPKSDVFNPNNPYQGQGLNIVGNKLIGYNESTTDKMYMSAGIFVAEGYPMIKKPFFGITDENVKSMRLDGDYYHNVNTFENCAYGYVRMSEFDWSKPAVGQTVEFALVQNADALQNAIKYAMQEVIIDADKDKKENAIIYVDEGIYDLPGLNLSDVKGLEIVGKGDSTVLNITADVYGQAGIFANQNITLKDFKVVMNNSLNVNAIKVTGVKSTNTPQVWIDKVLLNNITIVGGKGLNIHGAIGVVIDGVKISNSKGASIAFAVAQAKVINTTTTNGTWGSAGLMFNDNDETYYPISSNIEFGTGNSFNEGCIYEEPITRAGVLANTIAGLDNWNKFVNERNQIVYVQNELPQGAYISKNNVTRHYSSIQSAVAAAVDGDIINIAKGNYLIEPTLVINKSITINGSLEGGTVIQNVTSKSIDTPIIKITGATVNINNISFIGSGAEMNVDGSTCIVAESNANISVNMCTFSNFDNGICSYSATNMNITRCIFNNVPYGIYLQCATVNTSVNITGNIFDANCQEAIFIECSQVAFQVYNALLSTLESSNQGAQGKVIIMAI